MPQSVNIDIWQIILLENIFSHLYVVEGDIGKPFHCVNNLSDSIHLSPTDNLWLFCQSLYSINNSITSFDIFIARLEGFVFMASVYIPLSE